MRLIYQAVTPSFTDDVCLVTDPASKFKHIFFGGNYPFIYGVALPLINDTATTLTVEFLLASNDKFGVDTYTGVVIGNKFIDKVSPAIVKGNRWRVWSLMLAPGECYLANMRIIPLGSKWGGLVGTLAIKE